MQAKASESDQPKLSMAQRQHAGGKYQKVFDQRKRRIRGLWKRNHAFYAQIIVADPQTGEKAVRRTRLEDKDGAPVSTVAEAVKGMERLRTKREDDSLRLDPKRTPGLADYSQTYLDRLVGLGDAKRPETIRRERQAIRTLNRHLGATKLRQITAGAVNGYMGKRRAEEVSAHCVNIEVVTLRNVLRSAIEDGYLSALPSVKRLREPKPMRRMLTLAEIEAVATSAQTAPLTGQMVADFIRLMSYSGGRWGETLRLRWQDVDFERNQIHFGADGKSKNGESRAVDFNPMLAEHLQAMAKRRAPDSAFLFPARHRNERKDMPSVTFNKTLREARVKAGVPDFTCHACRHFFASMCLMSKVDLQTVASWLGHKDNGILLAKTYAHLLQDHKRAQAAQVVFTPVAVAEEKTAS